MAMPSEGIKILLVNAGVGVFNGHNLSAGQWGIYVAKIPDEATIPNAAIGIFDSGGSDPNPRWGLDYPRIQTMVRGDPGDYQGAYSKCLEIQKVLLGRMTQTVNGDLWDAVHQRGGINHLSFDDANRPLFSMNFQLIMEPTLPVGANRDPL